MVLHRLLMVAAACAAGAGCVSLDDRRDRERPDTGSSSTSSEPPPGVVSISYGDGCLDAERFGATLDRPSGTGGPATLDIWETNSDNGWNEEHYLQDVAGSGELGIVLSFVSTIPEVTWDESGGAGTTLFSCHVGGQFTADDVLTFALRVYDDQGALARCCAFGYLPEVVADGTYFRAGGDPSAADELTTCVDACGL